MCWVLLGLGWVGWCLRLLGWVRFVVVCVVSGFGVWVCSVALGLSRKVVVICV